MGIEPMSRTVEETKGNLSKMGIEPMISRV
jgi:hypothetical protein